MRSSSEKPCFETGAGLVGKGWVAAVRSPGTSLAGTRAFFDGPDRLSGHAIEDEDQAHLGRHDDRGDLLARDLDVDKGRGRGEIVVPESVVDRLKMPDALAGHRIQADDRFREEVVTLAVPAVVVVARRSDGEVEEPALLVECDGRPGVGVARSGARTRLPRSRFRTRPSGG